MHLIRTNLYKRRHRSGQEVWMVRWLDTSTGMWRAVTGGRSKDEAMIVEIRVREALLRGDDPNPKREIHRPFKVHEVIEAFYQSSRFMTGTPRWQRDARNKIDRVLLPELGEHFFKKLDREKVFGLYVKLKQEKGISNKTVRHYHQLLCILGDTFMDLTAESDNPIRKIGDFTKRFKLEAPTRDINFLTPEEIERVLKELEKSPSPLIYPLVKFLAHSGLRRSEALNLKWSDVDRSGGFIQIRKSKSGKPRSVPLEKEAWEAIECLREHSEFVFATREGTRYNEDSYIKPLQRAARRAKIGKRVDLHTFRHSFGSNKIRRGWGLKKVSMMLGHSDIKITEKVYTHFLDGDLKVQDDFVFDSRGLRENSNGSGEESVLAELAAKLLQKLESMPAEALASPAFALGLRTALQASNPTAKTSEKFEKSGDLAANSQSAQNRNESTLTLEKGDFATLMLRAALDAPVASGDQFEFSNDLKDLNWWLRAGSNRRPAGYESAALTI